MCSELLTFQVSAAECAFGPSLSRSQLIRGVAGSLPAASVSWYSAPPSRK